MKKSKFPTTEKEVIEFELKNKDNYVEPKEWTSINDIIKMGSNPTLQKYWEANSSTERTKVVEDAFSQLKYLKEQLNLHDVIKSISVNNEKILGILTQEQVDRGVSNCDICKYKKCGNGGTDCTECINYGHPHQYFL